jgi:hypothetical protein
VFVPAVPDTASIARKQANALIINASGWDAFIYQGYQGTYTSASVTAYGPSGPLVARFRLLKGPRILHCLWRSMAIFG